MISFIEEYYFLCFRSAEVFAALAGILCFKKFKNDKASKYLIYFLIYINCIEILASYTVIIHENPSFLSIKETLKNTVFEKNYWWYFLTWFIGANVFYSCYYYLIAENTRIKKAIKLILLLTLIFQFIFFVLFLSSSNYDYMIYAEVIDLFVIVFLISSYFIQLLNSEKIISFYKLLPFYVSIGTLVFFIVTTPLTFFERYFTLSDPEYISLKYSIKFFAIIFMYAFIGIGFIVSKPKLRN